MGAVELRHAGEVAYREALPSGEETAPPVLLVHGFPESSLMWVPLMERLAGAGRRCVAPDLYGLGVSAAQEEPTFETNLALLGEFCSRVDLGRLALVVHDWGGFLGLAWACEHRDEVDSLVISDTGFFSDGRWHGLADAVRGPEGEAIVNNLDRDGFIAMLTSAGLGQAAAETYWRPFEEGRGRRSTLAFYRSMDFEKLAPYDGCLESFEVPALILWGEKDDFATLAAARRFHREMPNSSLVVVEGAGHFVWDEEPERCVDEVVSFLGA